MGHIDKQATDNLSADEHTLLNSFLDEHSLFYGPDPAIMRDHRHCPRSSLEDAVLSGSLDPHAINLVRGRLHAALDETYDMVEQMGTAPGAKWGDLVTAVYTASGDLSSISPKGVVVFSGVCHYPLKFIAKYWAKDPTVGLRQGDGFIHNDSRYGNIHNTDQSMIMPVFHEGELVCWVSSTIHEGENGACEPGGMPAAAESKWDEGLKMPPFRIVENYQIRRDLLTFLQNSVRDPKLQYEDIKVKLHACMRLVERIRAVIAEYGKDNLVACLRKNIEDVDAEVRRRIRELPDGTVRAHAFIDGTLRENALIKYNLAVTIQGERMTIDVRGSSPEFTNRSINTTLASLKTCIATAFLLYIWPDLPHNMACFSSVDVLSDENSLLDASFEAPNCMSLIPLFKSFTLPTLALAKFLYGAPKRYTAIYSSHFNQPYTFIYGGITQHGEVTGNFCADINGNGGGARENRDGEHAIAPCFGYMCDTGEQELIEEELPVLRLVAQHLTKDRVGFGKYRGGLGYEQLITSRDAGFWGFMTGGTGSLHPSAYGLFGGYASPVYALCKIRDINIFDTLKTDPKSFKFDLLELMNEQAIAGGRYGTYDMGMTFEPVQEGEVYMICQGSGAGYGDVLERDPQLVMKDLEEDLMSHERARALFHVVYDPETLVVDEEATALAREAERSARKRRGRPYREFVADWVKAEPPENLPYYGSWDDASLIYAGVGKTRTTMRRGAVQGVMMADPKDVRIAQLEAQLAAATAGRG
jgi:N-methylhydantoinase B/oxoprolinase/acetone carboxylase alpha subunit